MKTLKRIISALLLFVFAFAICFAETNLVKPDPAFGEEKGGAVSASKIANWSQTTANIVNIEIEETKNTGTENPAKILFLGTLCSVHNLTKETVITSLHAAASYGDVDYYLFKTDRSLVKEAEHIGSLSMNASFETVEAQLAPVTLGTSRHASLYDFAQVLKNVTDGDEVGKTHYDYIIMEFDGFRQGHFIDGEETSESNKAAIDAAVDVMKAFYAKGKVSWIIPHKSESASTVYPYNYTSVPPSYQFTNSAKVKDQYMFNDKFMDNDDDDYRGSTDALKARDRVNVRNCIKLLAPEDLDASKEVPNVPYLKADGTISDAFQTLRERLTADEDDRIWVYYDNSADVSVFLKKVLSQCSVTVEDKVAKGLTVKEVRGEYKAIGTDGLPTGEWLTITQKGGFSYNLTPEADGTKLSATFDPNKIYSESYKVDSANNIRLVISFTVDQPDPTQPDSFFTEDNDYKAATNVGDAVITAINGIQKNTVYMSTPTITPHVPVEYHFVNAPSGTDELLPNSTNVELGAAYKAASTDNIKKDGYVFSGWYTDNTGTTKYTDDTVLLGATDLYGFWYSDISAGTVTAEEQTYNGKEQSPDNVIVKDVEGKILTEGTDYDLTVTKGTHAGDYEILVAGKENYVGTLEGKWTIAPREATATADNKSKLVGEKDPAFTGSVKNVVEGEKIELKFSREEGEEVGEYAIIPYSDNTDYEIKPVKGILTINPKDKPAPATFDDYHVFKMTFVAVVALLFIIFGGKLFIDSLKKQ